MHWSRAAYLRLIVLKYGVVILGMPEQYRKHRFTPPSKIKEVNDLGEMTRLWKQGTIKFHKLTTTEHEEIKGRCDHKKRNRAATTTEYKKPKRLLHETGLKCKQRPKSVAYIENSDVEETEEDSEDA